MTNRKVFGIGSIKTGTTTLGIALKSLGLNHLHGGQETADTMMPFLISGEYKKIYDTVDKSDSFEDIPFCYGEFYRILLDRYPESKFILTVRDSESWVQSMISQFRSTGEEFDSPLKKSYKHGWMGAYEYFKLTYGDIIISQNKKYVIDTYEKRNEEVISFFEDKKDKLLVLDIPKNSSENNWKLLCNFLEKPIRNIPFPHSNKKKSQ